MATLWYFKWPQNKIKTALNWTFFKHFGSIALSSMILATVWVIQLLLQALIYFLKSDNETGQNTCFIWIAKCFKCCIDCFEKCVTFISKQAYVEIA